DLDPRLAHAAAAARVEVEPLAAWSADPGPGAPARSDAPGTGGAGRGPSPRPRHVGTVASLREFLGELGRSGAADGVVLRPLALSSAIRLLATGATALGSDEATGPRGAPRTLRDRLGLPRPLSRYAVRTQGGPS